VPDYTFSGNTLNIVMPYTVNYDTYTDNDELIVASPDMQLWVINDDWSANLKQ
jgi:hypothetical protein